MDILKKLTQKRLLNARKPTGWLGRFLIRAMNTKHAPMTNWGLSHLSIGKSDTILDIGCGGGGAIRKLARIATCGEVYGIDLSDESVYVSRMTNKKMIQMGRVEIQQSTVSCMPFSDNLFDLITAINTHYYWTDLVTDMQEILRVLKPGGALIIIGNLYDGGKNDKRNHSYAQLIKIASPSIHELGEMFLTAGYSEVRTDETYHRGWMCVIGKKPSVFVSEPAPPQPPVRCPSGCHRSRFPTWKNLIRRIPSSVINNVLQDCR
jgi:SAM-dependent methyltransferase